MALVIAKGEAHISTPKAYGELDRIYNGFRVGTSHAEELLTELKDYLDGGKMPTKLYNIFEQSIPDSSGVDRIKATLTASGACLTLMSGSGPSVFGIFKNPEDRARAVDALRKEGYFAAMAESVEV